MPRRVGLAKSAAVARRVRLDKSAAVMRRVGRSLDKPELREGHHTWLGVQVEPGAGSKVLGRQTVQQLILEQILI